VNPIPNINRGSRGRAPREHPGGGSCAWSCSSRKANASVESLRRTNFGMMVFTSSSNDVTKLEDNSWRHSLAIVHEKEREIRDVYCCIRSNAVNKKV